MPEPETSAPAEKKNKGGRPPSDIDPKKLEALCQVHATDDEIAAHFGVSTKTIQRLKRKPDYAALFEKGRADGKISLRRAQWQSGLSGNTGMLVWLGKQILGQRDQISHSGPDGGPIELAMVRKQLDSLSDSDFADLAKQMGVELPEAAEPAK